MIDLSSIFHLIISELNNSITSEREKNFEETEERDENSVGISSLLSCPIKYKLKKQYKDVYKELSSDSLEIHDGFLFERDIKSILKQLFGNKFKDEVDLIYEIKIDEKNSVKIHTYLDCLIEFDDFVIAIELKHPKVMVISDFKYDEKFRKSNEYIFIINDDEVIQNSKYITQAKIEKFILEKTLFKDKKVYQFLFYKTLLVGFSVTKKAYLIYEVKDSITERELYEICDNFLNGRKPNSIFECSYCPFALTNYCDYFRNNKIFEVIEEIETIYRYLNDNQNFHKDLMEKDFWRLYGVYKNLEKSINIVKSLLLSKLRSKTLIKLKDGRKIGWSEEVSYYEIKNVEDILKENMIEDLKDVIEVRIKDTENIPKLTEKGLEIVGKLKRKLNL